MKNTKSKTMSLNMISSLVCQLLTVASGLIVQRYILVAFGSTYNGLTSLVSQIISYLVLLEAGIGAASIQAFYHPMNQGDWNSINGIMNATAKSYRQVGYMFGALLAVSALIIPLAAVGEIDYIIAVLITLIAGGGNMLTYMISGKYVAFINAERKSYVRYTITSVSIVVSSVLRIVAIVNGRSLVEVQAINLLCVFVQSIVLATYVRRKYPLLDRKVKPDFKAISKRWNVLVHSIAGLVVNHTDIIFLSIGKALKFVSVYSVYNMIYSHIGHLIQITFVQALQGDFGRIFDKDKKEFERLYAVYETMFTVFLFVVSTLAIVLTLPFVGLYTKGVTDVKYIDVWLPVLFVAVFLLNQIRTPVLLTINATGAFKETQRGAIIEPIICLVASLSLFLFTDLGMYGLLLGKVCSFVFRTTDVFCYVYRHVISRSVKSLTRLVTVNAVTMGVFIYILYIWKPICVNNYAEWVLCALLLGVVVLTVYVLMNLLFNRNDTKLAVDYVCGALKKKFFKGSK